MTSVPILENDTRINLISDHREKCTEYINRYMINKKYSQ